LTNQTDMMAPRLDAAGKAMHFCGSTRYAPKQRHAALSVLDLALTDNGNRSIIGTVKRLALSDPERLSAPLYRPCAEQPAADQKERNSVYILIEMTSHQ
jgi:hypothetical protein